MDLNGRMPANSSQTLAADPIGHAWLAAPAETDMEAVEIRLTLTLTENKGV